MSAGQIRKRNGPGHQKGGEQRAEWERHLLAKLFEQVQPTDEELARIEAALPRWGKDGRPTFCELLEPTRPGLESLASLIAKGVEPAEAVA